MAWNDLPVVLVMFFVKQAVASSMEKRRGTRSTRAERPNMSTNYLELHRPKAPAAMLKCQDGLADSGGPQFYMQKVHTGAVTSTRKLTSHSRNELNLGTSEERCCS